METETWREREREWVSEWVREGERESERERERERSREKEVESKKVREWERALCDILILYYLAGCTSSVGWLQWGQHLCRPDRTKLCWTFWALLQAHWSTIRSVTWLNLNARFEWLGGIPKYSVPKLHACQGCLPFHIRSRSVMMLVLSRKNQQSREVTTTPDAMIYDKGSCRWNMPNSKPWWDGGFELCAGRPLPGPSTSWQRCKTKVSILFIIYISIHTNTHTEIERERERCVCVYNILYIHTCISYAW